MSLWYPNIKLSSSECSMGRNASSVIPAGAAQNVTCEGAHQKAAASGPVDVVPAREDRDAEAGARPGNSALLNSNLSRNDTFQVTTEMDAPAKQKFCSSLSQLYESKEFSDFILVSREGRELAVHRTILGARSRVFAAMFNTKDSKENQTGRCDVDDIDGETLDVLLRFMYGWHQPGSPITVNPGKLLIAADKYDFTALFPFCAAALAKSLGPDNAGDVLVLADQYGLLHLKDAALEKIRTGFKEFLRSNQLQVVRDHSVDLREEVLGAITVGQEAARDHKMEGPKASEEGDKQLSERVTQKDREGCRPPPVVERAWRRPEVYRIHNQVEPWHTDTNFVYRDMLPNPMTPEAAAYIQSESSRRGESVGVGSFAARAHAAAMYNVSYGIVDPEDDLVLNLTGPSQRLQIGNGRHWDVRDGIVFHDMLPNPMTPKAAGVIQAVSKNRGEDISRGSYSARAQSAATYNVRQGIVAPAPKKYY